MVITIDGVRRLAEPRPPPLNSYWTASAHKRSRTRDSHAVGRPPCQGHEFRIYAELSSICSATQATILFRVPRGRPAPIPCACIPALCTSIPHYFRDACLRKLVQCRLLLPCQRVRLACIPHTLSEGFFVSAGCVCLCGHVA